MKVSWDDDIPNIWKFIKFMFQTANQLWPLWFSWLLASLISIFCVKKSHVLCCIHWHSTTRKRIGLETHQTWLCTNISGLTPVSREPLIAPLIHSRYVPSSQPVNQDIFHDSLGCLPYYPIKWITIPFDSHKVPLIPQNPMKIPWQSLQKSPSINGCFNKSVIIPQLVGRQRQDRGILRCKKCRDFFPRCGEFAAYITMRPGKKIGVQAHSLYM